jgi:hypothetical protein
MAAVTAAAVVLSACTGVPTSSSPQVVRPVNVAPPTSPAVSKPAFNADPRTMVLDFLKANALTDDNHANARTFLTPDASNRWSDSTVSVVDDVKVGIVTNGGRSVPVRGRELGSVNALGIYTPVLQGDGSGSVTDSFAFGMKQVQGQWRIDTLTSGLILSSADFERVYQQQEVYFYDRTDKHLVPDPRYTALSDGGVLANWLVRQLVTGPRPEMQNAWTRELPAQSDPRRVTVILGDPAKGDPARVELPGSGRLDPGTREHLAGQLALTLDGVVKGTVITILDGGRPVVVSSAGGTQFTASGFRSAVNPPNSSPPLFYIRSGAVVDANGTRLPGELGTGRYDLTSIALASQPGSDDLLAAGTSGPTSDARLLVGTSATGLSTTSVHGRLSRPTWAPNLPEVWVGVGQHVYVITGGGKPAVVPVAGTGTVTGRVSALRFSPEGSRIAMVLSAQDGSGAQVWVGSVVRTPGQAQVRIDSLEPITPEGIAANDVAWNDQLKLFVVGRVLSGLHDFNVYEVQVDGSIWRASQVFNLPDQPDSITVSENVPAWVSVGGTIWKQTGGTWSQPGGTSNSGVNPTYLE